MADSKRKSLALNASKDFIFSVLALVIYKNQGTAQNIQLELQDDSGNTLNTGATKTVQVDDSSQSAHFPLQVRALTVNGGATQGTIQAVISITYTYS